MPLTKAEITKLRGLRNKKNREAAQAFVVEGPKVVAELVAAGHVFDSVYATAEWVQQEAVPTEVIDKIVMAKISHFPTPSSVLAVGKIERSQLATDEIDDGFTLALDGIQDPGNVGTMLRIADWFGFDRVLLSPNCADLFSQKVINASMGSFARMRVITTDLNTALGKTSAPVLGCDLEGLPLRDVSTPAAAVLVIGSEGRGISSDITPLLTQRVTIPRHGEAESLNAAIAAGIVSAHLRS
jgi:TrmH family RNA methyltransferase